MAEERERLKAPERENRAMRQVNVAYRNDRGAELGLSRPGENGASIV